MDKKICIECKHRIANGTEDYCKFYDTEMPRGGMLIDSCENFVDWYTDYKKNLKANGIERKELTGSEFETLTCNKLKDSGWWALNIPRNKAGAQPFDVIALRGDKTLAVDCKVCSVKSFPISRVEDNQWLAFESVYKKASGAKIGLIVLCTETGTEYFIPYSHLEMARENNCASIKLTEIYAEMFKRIVE